MEGRMMSLDAALSDLERAALVEVYESLLSMAAERDRLAAALPVAPPEELARWHAKCDEVGIPHDPDFLVEHHRANATLAGYLNGQVDFAEGKGLGAGFVRRDVAAALPVAHDPEPGTVRDSDGKVWRLIEREYAGVRPVGSREIWQVRLVAAEVPVPAEPDLSHASDGHRGFLIRQRAGHPRACHVEAL
jgi:hypothetical protein